MHTRPSRKNLAGFSLVELIAVVAIIGITAYIAIPSLSDTFSRSKDIVAREVREAANLALKKHAQVNYQFVLPADNESGDDEVAIIRSLQWRDPLDPATGAPFLPPNWNPVVSTDLEHHRLRWNGMVFIILEPGNDGSNVIDPDTGDEITIASDASGIRVDFEATDYGENYTFPNDFVPVGG